MSNLRSRSNLRQSGLDQASQPIKKDLVDPSMSTKELTLPRIPIKKRVQEQVK